MRNKIGNAIFGILFLLIGLVVGLNTFDIININLFFEGWWTLFIIIPCIYSMIQNGFRSSNIVGLIVGVIFLLSARNVLEWEFIYKLILPGIFVIIGLNILFRDKFNKDAATIASLNKDGLVDYSAVFSGQNISVPNEVFNGASINAIFGGVDLNLKNAIIEKDIVINASAIFGGIDIIVPSNVKVKVKSTPVFGGIENKAAAVSDENAPTIYVDGVCMFGGIEIK